MRQLPYKKHAYVVKHREQHMRFLPQWKFFWKIGKLEGVKLSHLFKGFCCYMNLRIMSSQNFHSCRVMAEGDKCLWNQGPSFTYLKWSDELHTYVLHLFIQLILSFLGLIGISYYVIITFNILVYTEKWLNETKKRKSPCFEQPNMDSQWLVNITSALTPTNRCWDNSDNLNNH